MNKNETYSDPTLAENERIEEIIHLFHEEERPEEKDRLFIAICLAIRERMENDGHFIFPADINVDEEGNTEFSFKTLDLEIGPAVVAFTSTAELGKAPPSGVVSHFIDSVLETLMENQDIEGIILNPWGEALFMGKDDIGIIMTPGIERFI